MESPKSNKLLHELSEEELLEAFSEEEESEIDVSGDTILSFISFYNITSGENKVRSQTLFNLYKHYEKDPLTHGAFGQRLAKIFEQCEDRNFRYYLINESALDISKKAWELVQAKKKTPNTPKLKYHMESFMSHYEIERGKNWVHQDRLYYLYDKWVYKQRKQGLSKTQFKKLCNLYLESKKLTERSELWYGVNIDVEEKEKYAEQGAISGAEKAVQPKKPPGTN